MAIQSGPTITDVKAWVSKGGKNTFVIEGSDLDPSGKIFQSDPIKHKLITGFEIPPSGNSIQRPDLITILAKGTPWDQIMVLVYSVGGKITYKQIGNNAYEAMCDIPEPAASSAANEPSSL